MAEKIRVKLAWTKAEPLNVTLNSVVSGGKVTMPLPTIVQSHKVEISDTPTEGGTSAFSTGGAFNLQEQINKKANKEDIPTIPKMPTKLSELENDKEFATKKEVTEAISKNAPDLTPYVSTKVLETTLNEYATKEHIKNIVGGINSVLDEINGEVI